MSGVCHPQSNMAAISWLPMMTFTGGHSCKLFSLIKISDYVIWVLDAVFNISEL